MCLLLCNSSMQEIQVNVCKYVILILSTKKRISEEHKDSFSVPSMADGMRLLQSLTANPILSMLYHNREHHLHYIRQCFNLIMMP